MTHAEPRSTTVSRFKVVIPARYGSKRLPGKPLRLIGGKPLIQHVFERAQESGAETVLIATDDERIVGAAADFGAVAVLTDTDHQSGSERIAEVVETQGWEDAVVIVNLQGDEPFMPGSLIHQVAEDLKNHPHAPMTTLCECLSDAADLTDPHVVKVVLDRQRYALYFSRAPIPWDRDRFPLEDQQGPLEGYYRHIGLYAYRAGFVKRYVRWPSAPLEKTERLEQLRVLWHGERIHVSEARQAPGMGVDTEADLRRAEAHLHASR